MPGLNKNPRSNKYAKFVTFTSIQDAKNSAAILEKEFRITAVRSKRLLMKQVVNYASNRASGKAKEKNISPATRQRYAEISRIYRDLFNRLKFIESSCT